MCPWPRIQAALQDEESLIVSYHPLRGEPRGAHKKGDAWGDRGHCVDCNQCVAVCPMGIDIRDGQQMECISCALCIDACDGVMDKVGLPRGLIGYDTLAGLHEAVPGKKHHIRLIRPRTILYAAALAVVGAIMLFALLTRSTLELDVEHDRNPVYIVLADGSIRNAYTLKIRNKETTGRSYRLEADGVDGIQLTVVGNDDALIVNAPADQLRSYRVLVTAPKGALTSDEGHVRFKLTDMASGTHVEHKSDFRGPHR